MPLILNPPNGCRQTIAPVHLRLMYRLPTRNRRFASAMWAGLRLYTAPVRAYFTPVGLGSTNSAE